MDGTALSQLVFVTAIMSVPEVRKDNRRRLFFRNPTRTETFFNPKTPTARPCTELTCKALIDLLATDN